MMFNYDQCPRISLTLVCTDVVVTGARPVTGVSSGGFNISLRRGADLCCFPITSAV